MKAHGWLGLLILLGTYLGLYLDSDWVRYNLFFITWWPYILVADSLVYRLKGNSLLVNRTRQFFLLLPWSVVIWLIFEDFNFILRNWYYVNVPPDRTLRWFGYAFSFATVLPGVFETTEILSALGLFARLRVKPRKVTPALLRAFEWIGAVFFVLFLLFPRIFYPLVWGAFVFLLEPLLYRKGGRSLLRQWEEGSLRQFVLLLVAGLICGFLWEIWNYPAAAKWIYTVPFLDQIKWFEMPPLGFVGFPPFAVECYVMVNTLCLFVGGPNWELPAAPARGPFVRWQRGALGILMVVFSLLVFNGIDAYTVDSYAIRVAEIPALDAKAALDLRSQGLKTLESFLRATRGLSAQQALASGTGIPLEVLQRAAQEAQFISLRGLGLENLRHLRWVGIESVPALAAADPVQLYAQLQKVPSLDVERSKLSLAKVRVWVTAARRQMRRKG